MSDATRRMIVRALALSPVVALPAAALAMPAERPVEDIIAELETACRKRWPDHTFNAQMKMGRASALFVSHVNFKID